MSRLLIPILALAVADLAMAQELPNPYARSDEPTIGPAPVPAMEQMFWVQLKLDPATPVEVVAPEGHASGHKARSGRRLDAPYFRSDAAPRGQRSSLWAPHPRAPTRRTYREDMSTGSRRSRRTQRAQTRPVHYTDEMLAAQANLAAHRAGGGHPRSHALRRDDRRRYLRVAALGVCRGATATAPSALW